MKRLVSIALFVLAIHLAPVSSSDNGLARTPPMGWMSWARYTCNVDCHTYPDECIDENLFRDMIDRVVDDGYLKAGYQFVNIDDCWMATKRDPATGRLMANQTRFPSGLKSLADYAHSRGLLLGIYEDVGSKTCMGYPGTYSNGKDNVMLDAQTFSDWGMDSLKLDGCYLVRPYEETYPEYNRALRKVEHPIMYACSWPAYLQEKGNITDDQWESIRENCNYWRNYGDIDYSWATVRDIIEFYGNNSEQFSKFHGPGGWFDPDMLLIGNNGLSYEQSKAQMAIWCMWSAPLLMSNDLRNMEPKYKEILLNRELIAIDQDPLGIMATRVFHDVWVKKLSKSSDSSFNNPYAVLYFADRNLGVDLIMSFQLLKIVPELNRTTSYQVYDLYGNGNDSYLGTLKPTDQLRLRIPTAGAVRIVKLVPIEQR